jgi:hypothetical protein
MYIYTVCNRWGGRGSACVESTKYGAGRWARTTKREKWGRQVGKDIQEGKVGQAGGSGQPTGKSGAGRWVRTSRREEWGRQVGQDIQEGKVG